MALDEALPWELTGRCGSNWGKKWGGESLKWHTEASDIAHDLGQIT